VWLDQARGFGGGLRIDGGSVRASISKVRLNERLAMKRKYTYEETWISGRPPEIEMHAYNAKKDFEQASVGIIEVRGRHGRVNNPVSDRTYLVLEGEGEFYFGGEVGQQEETIRVKKDDVLLIPKGTVYDYQGQMRLFLVHSPAYEQDSDIHYDDLWE
jgi:mannose-6-phosphate isomerase-like protein (cupin superfamily)